MLASFRAKHLQKKGWKVFFVTSAILICMSTVFMKQHSIIDVFWALVVCVAAEWLVIFSEKRGKKLSIATAK